jgi:hypothetical protein
LLSWVEVLFRRRRYVIVEEHVESYVLVDRLCQIADDRFLRERKNLYSDRAKGEVHVLAIREGVKSPLGA